MLPGEARLYEAVLLQILQGQKVFSSDYPGHIIGRLLPTLERLYQSGNSTYEPQTLIHVSRYAGHETKFMGQSLRQSISSAHVQEAQQLIDVLRSKGKDISPFEFLGLGQDALGDEQDVGHARGGVLISGIPGLYQAMRVIRMRAESPVHAIAPIIIQNTGHIWGLILQTDRNDWPARRRKLEKLGVYVTSGAPETAELLAELPAFIKMSPSKLELNLTDREKYTGRHAIFPTGDKIKHRHTHFAHATLTPKGTVRFASDVFGPSGATPEENYSYTGNVEEKLRAFLNYLRSLGVSRAEQLLRHHDYAGHEDVMLVFNDGGLGFSLENPDGIRRADLFTAEAFPETYHKLNPMQSGPGVELAYMKRTAGLRNIMTGLWRRVDSIVAEDDRFDADDLVAYDTSVYMAVPLTAVLSAIRKGEEFDYDKLGVVTTSAVQKLRIAREPNCPPVVNPETEDYLIPPGQTLARSADPEWFRGGPNAHAYKLLHQAIGSDFSGDEAEQNLGRRARLGLLATPNLMHKQRDTGEIARLKRMLLHDWDVSTQQGPDVWSRFRESEHNHDRVVAQASHGTSITAHDETMVRLLNESGVLYFGDKPEKATDLERMERTLLLLRAIVRNQTYNWTNLVVREDTEQDILALIRHKQSAGLIPQQLRDIMTLASDTEDAAEKIADMARNGHKRITSVERKFTSNGVSENRDCMMITTYFSATNCSKSLQTQAERLGYLIAANGFSMKFGGGNDGLMKAAAMGFLKGKQELREKGYHFPNQLIAIQCVDTEAIEKPFEIPEGTPEWEVVARCHRAIEPREGDLQNTGVYGMSVVGSGGSGTDEEAFDEFVNRLKGLIDPKTHPLVMFNQQIQTGTGRAGVNDPYKQILSPALQEKLNIGWAITPEEVVARGDVLRASQLATHVLPLAEIRRVLHDVNSGLTETMARAAAPVAVQKFRPPFDFYTGPAGGIPPRGGSLQLLPALQLRQQA